MWISYLMRKLFCCCWKTRCKPDRKSVVKPVPVYTKNNFKYWPIWKWFWTNCLRKPQQTSPNVRSHIWQKATNQSSTPCDDGFTTTECLKKKKQQPQHIVVPVVLQYIILFPLYRGTYHIARFMLTHSPMVHKLWSTICCHLCFFFFNNSHCENHSSSFIKGPLIQTGWPFPVNKDSPWLNSGSLNLYQNLTSCVS